MANGRLGASTPTINTDTQLYQVPSSTTASVSVNICNTDGGSALVRLSIEDSGASSIDRENCIEYDVVVSPNSVLERGGIVLGSQQKLFCRSSASNVNFIVYGYEE